MVYFLRASLITQLPPKGQMMDCNYSANLIIEAMGGPRIARSFWVEEDSHKYVVRVGQLTNELAYNNTIGLDRTVGWVMKHGI